MAVLFRENSWIAWGILVTLEGDARRLGDAIIFRVGNSIRWIDQRLTVRAIQARLQNRPLGKPKQVAQSRTKRTIQGWRFLAMQHRRPLFALNSPKVCPHRG